MYMNTSNIFLVYKLCFLWINYLSFDIPLRHYSSPPLSKTFLFRSPHLVPNVPSSTRSPTQNGMCTCFIVHAASMILDAQLVWHERMSIRSVCKCCTLGRIIIEVIVTPVLCRTASCACMRPMGHHRHWLAEHHMLSATKRPAAKSSGGCQVLQKYYLLLPACKKNY